MSFTTMPLELMYTLLTEIKYYNLFKNREVILGQHLGTGTLKINFCKIVPVVVIRFNIFTKF